MGEKITIGPINNGLRNDRTAFVIDNDSFPTIINAYQWRGRVKRRRGTALVGRLSRFFNSSSVSYSSTASINLVAGAANILTGFSLQANGNIIPGSVTIVDITAGNTYTDPGLAGILVGVPGGTGTINYATGDITIAGGGADLISAVFRYYPDLPVMGLEDLVLNSNDFPGNLAFDTKYSYNIRTVFPYDIYDVSFYKNPASTVINGIAYTQKTNWTPTTWNGEDYQQFWTVNYQGALWATNGIRTPFVTTKYGMQFQIPNVGGITRDSATQMTFVINNCPLVIGDWVFLNEFISTVDPANAATLNFQTGFVTSVVTVGPTSTVIVRFPYANIAADTYTDGMIQYLTNRSDITRDCIRWYDGDPTDGNLTNPTLSSSKGWVNFCPPLSQFNYSIADLPQDQYYLVGAKAIVPFKDRLLFIGPIVQTSATNSQRYLKDTVIYSQNGTPYYTASFSGDIFNPTNPPGFFQLLVPDDQTAFPTTFWEDQTGFGGFITAGVEQAIQTVSNSGDVLLLGFTALQTRLVYSGTDIIPFNFFIINSELGSSSTFSSVNMDRGAYTIGERGIVLTSQVDAARVDLSIPDEVFRIRRIDNGTERVCSQRDFINEWIYFTYPSDRTGVETHKFPTQSLQYNYRDDSWAIFRECYTTYGSFKKRTGFTWATVGTVYATWSAWNEPWSAGASSLLEPEVLAGNQQGFVFTRDDGTSEANSLYIQSFSGNQITSPDHCLSNGDFIIISGCIGTIGALVNNRTFKVYNAKQNTFRINPTIGSGTYSGGGVIKRIYVPNIQTKQFPVAWGMGRKCRLGVQQYLLTTTIKSQIQLLIFLSQNSASAYNSGKIVPQLNSENSGLIYSTVLYTCPESTNIGLTPANINLQMPDAVSQNEIWHRVNTSLIGDTVQLGFTISEEQILSLTASGTSFAITAISQAYPAVMDTTAKFPANSLFIIEGVEGMTELNGNVYTVISSTDTQVTINVDSTAFSAYVSDGTATRVSNENQFAEIELHGIILDVTPSQMLV